MKPIAAAAEVSSRPPVSFGKAERDPKAVHSDRGKIAGVTRSQIYRKRQVFAN
jgi:hypothetical protein